MSIDNAAIVEALSTKTVMELLELIKLIESRFEVSAAAAPSTAAAAEVPVVEEQTEFDVVLKSIADGAKVLVIKAVRAATGLGLIESKSLVEGTPSVIKGQISKEEAESLKTQLTEAGGVVEIR